AWPFARPTELPAGKEEFNSLVEHIEWLVHYNRPDRFTRSTIDPQNDERGAREVVEQGFRDTRHFCESTFEKTHGDRLAQRIPTRPHLKK
ncbi:hypothetical protein PENTCL1PPCAC_21013, partial [Pristionchus entomophagus]